MTLAFFFPPTISGSWKTAVPGGGGMGEGEKELLKLLLWIYSTSVTEALASSNFPGSGSKMRRNFLSYLGLISQWADIINTQIIIKLKVYFDLKLSETWVLSFFILKMISESEHNFETVFEMPLLQSYINFKDCINLCSAFATADPS